MANKLEKADFVYGLREAYPELDSLTQDDNTLYDAIVEIDPGLVKHVSNPGSVLSDPGLEEAPLVRGLNSLAAGIGLVGLTEAGAAIGKIGLDSVRGADRIGEFFKSVKGEGIRKAKKLLGFGEPEGIINISDEADKTRQAWQQAFESIGDKINDATEKFQTKSPNLDATELRNAWNKRIASFKQDDVKTAYLRDNMPIPLKKMNLEADIATNAAKETAAYAASQENPAVKEILNKFSDGFKAQADAVAKNTSPQDVLVIRNSLQEKHAYGDIPERWSGIVKDDLVKNASALMESVPGGKKLGLLERRYGVIKEALKGIDEKSTQEAILAIRNQQSLPRKIMSSIGNTAVNAVPFGRAIKDVLAK